MTRLDDTKAARSPGAGQPVGRRPGVAGRLDESSSSAVAGIRRYGEEGGCLLLVVEPGDRGQAEITGVIVGAQHARAEWFVTLADRPEAARLDREVPVTGPVHVLAATGPDVEVVATTSVAFQHRGVLAVRRLGLGTVLTTGIADLDALLAHPVLGRYARRLLATPGWSAPHPRGGRGRLRPVWGHGLRHGLAATETDGLAFVAAVDPVPERLAVAVAEFPGLRTYATADEVATDVAVDVAIVATPPAQHADLAVALLEAGKHVVVEKPMCLTVADADRMIAAGALNDRVLTFHQSRRWDPDFLALTRAVDRGLVCEVLNVETLVGGFAHRAGPGTPRRRCRGVPSTTGVRTTSTGSSAFTASRRFA